MDIQNLSANPYRAQLDRSESTFRVRENGGDTAQSKSAAASTDTVNVSQDGMLRTTALATALSTPDIRQGKVDAIKEQLANGTYSVDSKNIASKMLQDDNFW